MPSDAHSTSTASPPASHVRTLLGQPALPAHPNAYAPHGPSATIQPSIPQMQSGWPVKEGTHSEEDDWVEAELEIAAAGADPATRGEPVRLAGQVPNPAPPQASPVSQHDAAIPLHPIGAPPVAQSGPQPAPPISLQTRPVMQPAAEMPQPPQSKRAQADGARPASRSSVVAAEEQPAAVEFTTIDIPGRATEQPEVRHVEQSPLPAPALKPGSAMTPAELRHAEATTHLAHPLTTVQASAAQQPTPSPQTMNPGTSADVEKRGSPRLPEPATTHLSTSQPTSVRQGTDQTLTPRATPQRAPDRSFPVEVVRTGDAGQNAATPLSQKTVVEPFQLLSRQTESPALMPVASEPILAQRQQEATPLLARPGTDSGRVLSNPQPLPTIQPPSRTVQPSSIRDGSQRESAMVQELHKKVDALTATVAAYKKDRQAQAEIPPAQPIVILNRFAPTAPNTRAFWARSYRGRAHLRSVR